MRSEPGIARRLARGAVAGAAGAVVLWPADVLERRALGRPPPYDLGRVTRRLASRVMRREPPPAVLHWLARGLRLGYGASLGAVIAGLRWPPARAAAAVSALELWAMPAAGATIPARRWSRGERWLLVAHTSVFALAVAALLRSGP